MTLNDLKDILKEYYFDDVSCLTQGKGYNINSKNYLVTTSSKELFYLKMYHQYKNDIIKKIEIMNYCYQKNIKVPKLIKNKKGKLYTIKDNNLFFVTKFYDGKICNFSDKEIFSAGENLARLNKKLKNINTFFTRSHLYHNLNKKELDKIKKITNNKKILNLCNNLSKFYYELDKTIDTENNIQLLHLDYNIQNVLFNNNQVQVILDFDFLLTSPILQSVAFACNRFSKNKKEMIRFLEGYQQEYILSSEEINLIPIYIKKEALCRINYILSSYFFHNNKLWNFELDKHLNIIQKMDKLKWI